MPHLFSKLHGCANGLNLDRLVTPLLLVAVFVLAAACTPQNPGPTGTPTPTATPTPSTAGQRIPVLLVHGHAGDVSETWIEPGNGTSFNAVVGANQLPINISMPLPVLDPSRSIADDATDLLAIIEGGLDSRGQSHVGLLNYPVYQGVGRVAIIAYSQGALSSRYYIKNLMGSRRTPAGTITVSELVTLAAPNHGVGSILLACGNRNEPNRSLRQLCAGRMGLALPLPCNQCLTGTPLPFTSNQPGDDTFITDLNGHPLSDSCLANASFAGEAPFSRPTRADGILYVNLYATGDLFVGDGTQSGDCFGRRLARNLAPDVDNREFNVPIPIHASVPHHWEIICTALKTVSDHQAPAVGSPCAGLTRP